MNFIQNSHNSLLHRHDFVAKLTSPSNPNFTDVKEEVSKHFNKPIDCVVVRSIKGSFGSSDFIVEGSIYDSPENLQAVEPKPKVKKEAGN